jgi:hypothetical protein
MDCCRGHAPGVMIRPGAMRYVTAGAAMLVAGLAGAAYAQQIWVGGGGFSRMAPRLADLEDFDGTFLYCRALYTRRWREPEGQGWRTDYPGADNNLSVRLAELTTTPVKMLENGQPHHVVIDLTDPTLFRCPTLFMADGGSLEFSDEEVRALRNYFLKGGFLWVDDFWGSRAWDIWRREIGRVLTPSEFPIFEIPPEHPVMRVLYEVKSVPQVPNISFWRRSGGQTSERASDSRDVHFRGIQDSHGRLLVVMSHNTDIADTWEREGENQDYFDLFAPSGYAVGVNVVLYALSH